MDMSPREYQDYVKNLQKKSPLLKDMALAYHDQIVPAMAALRKPVDEMELLVDKSIWPVPTYGDLMFEV